MKQQMDKELSEACAEAFRRGRERGRQQQSNRAAQAGSIDLKEPISFGIGHRSSESAANSSFINLRENNTVNIQTDAHRLTEAQRFQEEKRKFDQEMADIEKQQAEAFQRMGYSESAAKRMAEPSEAPVFYFEPAPLTEAQRLAESRRLQEENRVHEQAMADTEKRFIEVYKGMGMNDEQIKQIMTPRGEYRY